MLTQKLQDKVSFSVNFEDENSIGSFSSSVPGKRGVSGQKPEKPGFLARQNEWYT